MQKRGFTLIELLVVISIIGLLASIVVVSLNSARAKARDGKRVASLNQLRLSLELYYDKNNEYPDNTDSGDVGCWWLWDAGSVLNGGADTFIQPLEDDSIMKETSIETSPVSGGGWQQCSYRYVRQPGPQCTCSEPYAVLYTVLEANSNPAGIGDERPSCFVGCWGEGGTDNDYAIYLPY